MSADTPADRPADDQAIALLRGWLKKQGHLTSVSVIDMLVAELERLRKELRDEAHHRRNAEVNADNWRQLYNAKKAEVATQEDGESRCHFCRQIVRPWLTTDEVWALVEPKLGQNQACLPCFYDALPADMTNGDPLILLLPE